MPNAFTKRRLVLFVGVGILVIFGVGLISRLTLTEMAVSSLLKMAGASEVKFSVARASPWTVVLEDIGFQLKTRLFAAKRISMARLHWWTPSLGSVRVEQALLSLTVDGSDVNTTRFSTAYGGGSVPHVPANLPVEDVHVDGQLLIRAADVPDQSLAVKLDARLVSKNNWTGNIEVEGPGLGLKGELGYDISKDQLDFKLPSIALDLKPWQAFVQRLIVLPGGTWQTEGKFTGAAEGHLAARVLTSSGKVQLREGRVRYEAKDITAEGIEADLEFTDFDKMLTKPGGVRVQEIRVGKFPLREISAQIAFAGREKIAVSELSLKTLGGRASAESFNYFPNLRELDVVVMVDGISVEEVMGLTKDLPAKATGQVNGRFPVRIDESGVRLGTGWLELKPGVYAELQLQASGLLTGNLPEKSSSYAVLKKVESGLLKLKIDELRLDIRPPNAPAGRSAQLRISGSPVDPEVKAPVTLDLNVNGPLEKLINLGLDSRVSFK